MSFITSFLLAALVGFAPVTLDLAFVGDIMLDRGVESSVDKNAGGDFGWIFSNVRELAESDILFGNLEGPLSDQGHDLGNVYSFRMRPLAAEALALAGFDFLSVANNHSFDWGRDAFTDTISRLKAVNIVPTGVNNQVAVIIKNGVRIGFLAATDVGGGGVSAADSLWPEAITRAAGQVDFLVVSYHWGEEYQSQPTERQKYLAQLAIDRGAKIVVGHHSHVVGPVERYNNGLIAYGLGNFVFDQYFSDETMEGAVLNVTILNGEIVSYIVRKSKLDANYQPHI